MAPAHTDCSRKAAPASWRTAAGLITAACLGFSGDAALAQPPPPGPTIEKLVGDGWEVAGYISAWENRSLILFRHKEHKYLVQCSVLIDVLRNPRIVTYCYELR